MTLNCCLITLYTLLPFQLVNKQNKKSGSVEAKDIGNEVLPSLLLSYVNAVIFNIHSTIISHFLVENGNDSNSKNNRYNLVNFTKACE